MTNNFRFTYKLAEESDKPMIREWIVQKHIGEWLHGDGLKNTLEDLKSFPDSESWGKHWIAYDREIPFAYLITSTLESDNPGDPETITLDLFICNLEYIGKGLSVQMIHEFLLSQFSHADVVLIDPEKTNTRAVHVYKKAGFEVIGEFIAEWHRVPHYKMQLSMENLRNNAGE